MNDSDYARVVWELYKNELEKRKNSDYEIDPVQMGKLIDAYELFSEVALKRHGSVEVERIEPKEMHGGITARFNVFYLSGNDLKRFSTVTENMSAISIDGLTNGEIEVSFTIPNVYRRKNN